MKIQRRRFLGIAVLLLPLLAVGTSARAGDDKEETKVRWDIVSLQPPPPAAPRNVLPGGIASARANDGSKITLTGSGTFEVGEANEVTGGGTWITFSPSGAETGRGTYRVMRLIRFEAASGTQPPGNIDRIGTEATVRAGLVVLGIAYSDRSRGTLIVSCHLAGTPDSVFEGITATKGFVGFWNREAPANGVDANRTVFHIVPEAED